MSGGNMSGADFSDRNILLRSNSSASDGDSESQGPSRSNKGIQDLLKRLDRGFSGRRLGIKRLDRDQSSSLDHGFGGSSRGGSDEILGDSAPPEWALLLIGCLLGLATGLCVAAFNRGVHVIHEWAWAGTPNEGAAWLRLQRLADTWHRVLLIPVTGGVIVGMMHGLLEILDQIKQFSSSEGQGLDLLAGVFPTVKAIQAAVTLGTGCSLGPEGPSVDIGKSCAHGCSVMMENNRERRIALVAAGAAAGISSGFNAPMAGCFFAIETVLRPLRAENSPPFTTAMIILASVVSSTVSNVILGEKQAFTVPTYDLKSAAELPLYLILGMLCGVVSVAFTRLVSWFNKAFEFIKENFGLPAVVYPASGGLGAGIIALKYPGILYWGFTNVDEILHTGKSASAPGIWLLAQLAAAKVVATSLCKGSGLVGGLYAPSLMIGAAVGAVFGGSAAELINSAIPGNAAVAQPQAYALVGMAATLASVCSVPLTSVLLLFELTKDYRILLPLMGAVGLAIWVPSITNQSKETEASDARSSPRGYSFLSPVEDKHEDTWRRTHDGDQVELSIIGNGANHEAIDEDIFLEDLKVSQAMSKTYVKVSPTLTLKDAIKCMHDGQQNCVLVVDAEDFLEGILTHGDIKRFLSDESGDASADGSSLPDVNTCLVSSICTRGISYHGQERGLLTCYPETDLAIAKKLMEAKGIKQLPVVKRGGEFQRTRKQRIVAILHYDSIQNCLSIIDHLGQKFSIKDLGSLHFFLGVEVIPTKDGLFLTQHKYIRDILAKTSMDGAKNVTTPLSTSVSLKLVDGSSSVDSTEYCRVLGALQYLSLTRPDISFAVNKLSQFMHRPTQTHWTATKRLLHYLKNTIFHGITIRHTSSPTLTCFSDADLAGSLDDRKSTSAYLLFLGHTPISWSSKKQRAIARSSTEAAYRALAMAAAESMWLLSLFQEMKFTLPHPPLLLCDNLGATHLSFNPVQHSRMKHIQIDVHFVRDLVDKKILTVRHVHTHDQLADLLTKPLSRQRTAYLRDKIGLSDGSPFLRGRIKETDEFKQVPTQA